MKALKKLFVVVLALAMLLSLAACGGSSSKETASEEPQTKLEQIKAAGKIVVGTSADYPPFEFHAEIDGTDQIVGTEISLVNYIAEDLGVEVEYVDMSFDGLVISLAKGDFDIVASCMRPSEERKQSIDFSDSWYDNNTVLVVKKGDAESQFASLTDLDGHKIAAQAGTTQYDWVTQFAGADNAVGLSKVSDMILDLKAGNVEGVLLEELTAKTYVAQNDDLAIVDIEYKQATGLTMTEGAAIGVQKGNEDLVEYLNTCIAEIKEKDLIGTWAAEASELAGTEE